MADDYGILISGPGNSVSGAKLGQLVMDSGNPFLKIDTQNAVGFQTITLLITNDPPEPPSTGGNTFTTVYKFKHGYTYIPTVEMLCFVQNISPSIHGVMPYFQDWGFLGGSTVNDQVTFYAVADATWVYLILEKSNFGGGSANNMSGTTLVVTTHVFVEDLGV